MTARRRLVVGTKLEVPVLRGRVIARPRLLRILRENANRPLVLVCAGAGYGKTTLVSQFCAELTDPFIYYNLEASDRDIVTFLEYLIHGLESRFPAFDRDVANLFKETQSIEIMTGALINEMLRVVHRDFYIILDDYHHLQAGGPVDHALDYLLTHAPANLHVIIASRTQPGLDLERYLAKQAAWIIGREQLEFRRDEVAALFRESYGLTLPEPEISQIMRHAEGWVTAVQLMLQRIAFAGYERTRETLKGYLDSGEDLFSYFARQVVDSLSGAMRAFLSGVAYLDWMTPEICDRLLKIRNSSRRLKRLESENLFIARSGRDTYRFHPLFQSFLQQAVGEAANRRDAAHALARIGRIFETSGDLETAADYYLRAADFERASRAVKAVGDALLQAGRFSRLEAWLDCFPRPLLESDAAMVNLKADLYWHTVRPEAAAALFEKAARMADRRRQPAQLFRAYYGLAKLRANAGRFREALSLLKRAGRTARRRSTEIVDTHNLEGVCHIYLGDFERAEAAFDTAVKLNVGFARNHSLMNNLAILAFTKGELDKSVRLFKDLARLRPSLLGEANTYSNIALALIDMGHATEARAYVAKAYWSSRRLNNARGFLSFLIALAFYYVELKDYPKAISYFTRLTRLAQEKNEMLFVDRAQYGLAKTYYLDGQPEQAEQVLAELIESGRAAYGIRNHDVYMTRGLVQHRLGRDREAHKTLLEALRLVENTPFKYSLMRNHYHLASFYQATGQIPKVDSHLDKALHMAEVNDYRYFLEKMAEFDPSLLQHAVSHGIAHEFARSILKASTVKSTVTINLFGDLHVWIEGKEIPSENWTTKKARLIFAYLVMNRSRPVTKEDLMAKFARQSDPRRADQDIRTTVARIQKALAGRRVIAYRRGIYSIPAPVKVETDVEEFEKRIATFLGTPSRSIESVPADLELALQAYHDGFLVEFYDDWVVEERARLGGLFVKAARIASDAYLKQGRHDKAESLCRRILETEPADLPVRLTLIRALQRQGLRDQALTYYRQYLKLAGKTRRDLPFDDIVGSTQPLID